VSSSKAKLKRVEVAWLDAITYMEHVPRAEAEKKPLASRSTIGYLISADRDCVRLASTYDESDDEFADITVIPRPWVKKVRSVR